MKLFFFESTPAFHVKTKTWFSQTKQYETITEHLYLVINRMSNTIFDIRQGSINQQLLTTNEANIG